MLTADQPTALDSHTLVHVSPGYLAGPRDPGEATLVAWPFLATGDWIRHCPPRGYILTSSPCQRIRAGFLPDGTGRGMWRTAAYDDPFAASYWTAVLDYGIPEEILGAFHQVLANSYNDGDSFLSGDTSTAPGYLPLLNSGWNHDVSTSGKQTFTAPDHIAQLTHSCGASPSPDYFSWRINSGRHDGHWEAAFTCRTPPRLIGAFTAAMVSSEPLTRTIGQLPPAHLPYVTLAPIATDTDHASARRGRSTRTASCLPALPVPTVTPPHRHR
ncbi:DUF317 domain-containing protein [Streptomyces phyllanthi]|uniref:DUF317 domain-containing protein n=1 Tax=Streptomyces phyllanthi TaxID=1803180 RepID=A0A5N8VUZ0_9ACTN|nr:DUF317 domain-containing protein [Streptomyces phyllanthi]MPY38496.1 DUF317 domain-containing protein [Streptomyces phyllanthi]